MEGFWKGASRSAAELPTSLMKRRYGHGLSNVAVETPSLRSIEPSGVADSLLIRRGTAAAMRLVTTI